jgi:hypothetical protein
MGKLCFMQIKIFLLLLSLVFLSNCSQQTGNLHRLQSEVDSLRHQLADTYTPGLGEFMSGIQVHHAKLWFAGTASNWELADFEIKEIQEAIEDIQKFNMDRPEVKSIGLIVPAIDSLNSAIQQQNEPMFEKGFQFLTATCNSCHRTTDHGFNVITIPTSPPVSNQRFELGK